MSAPYIIPFNHWPSATSEGSSSTYTVPTSKYARVTISLIASFSIAVSAASNGASVQQPVPICQVVSLWLRAGDVLVTSTTGTGAGGSVASNTYAAYSSSALATVNASAVASVSAIGGYNNGTGGSFTTTLTNSNAAYYHVEEYNVIS